MEEIMRMIFGFLATAAGIYSILIFIRIIISWFGNLASGKPVEILARITDPYLDWWRKNLNLRIGFLDFSVVAAIAALSVLQNILLSLSRSARITIGSILAVVLMAAWNVISFILGFCIIILILRLIAYLTNQNMFGTFWKVIDSISQPILYRLNRIFFGSRIGSFLKGIVLSILMLAAILIAGGFAVSFLAGLLFRLPV